MNIRALTKSLIIGIAVLAPTQCLAAGVPERFMGVWQAIENEDQACKASDWNSDRHTDTHIKIEAGLVRYHESECRFKSVTRPKPEFDSGAVHVAMTCDGEGERWSQTQLWQILPLGRNDNLAMVNVSKQRPGISLYRKCGVENAAVAPKDTTRAATDEAGDMRSALRGGRHCFAQKDEGAEFSLSVESSGSASFSVDVVNPRTKHLCSAKGAVAETARGWRYVDKSQPAEVCEIDIEISDRIRFRFANEGCERRYCGARASISSLEFSAQDKKESCSRK
ncbi:hypothetical protein [Nitrobacter winogradskyi]|uniref:Uncharacterized protein n=2 Tax=Nitrobacter winogradskyi TaxID=913 RepID=A0ACC6AFB4_NITWI|nr:hypothetical protein [Nitrobacter winogradskyi]MCP1998443.1 hypothetical protein [Nitrobacter winogradskyi]GEC16188.1 hypothetical protein NWI01_20800 [Nitrobacter winogradskyi]